MNTDLKAALTQNFPTGTCHALHSETYGNILIVATGIAGNLILYNNFYPAAYIRPESSTVVLNGEEPFPPNDDFHNLQKLIKKTFETVIECYSVDKFIEYVDLNQDFGLDAPPKRIKLNRFKRTIPEGYTKALKPEIQYNLQKNFPVGMSCALCNEYYGEIIIVSTGVVGNLILQHSFYPIAYIRPETLTAVLNMEDSAGPEGEFTKVQKLIKATCGKIIKCYSVDELIEYVDMNKEFGK